MQQQTDMLKYLSIPHKWAGRDWDGADCYGLLVLWFRTELGIELFDPLHRPDHAEEVARLDIFSSEVDREWVLVPFTEPAQRHDVALIKTSYPVPTHCGVCLDKYSFLHLIDSKRGPGCNVAQIHIWRPHVTGLYRHRSLA